MDGWVAVIIRLNLFETCTELGNRHGTHSFICLTLDIQFNKDDETTNHPGNTAPINEGGNKHVLDITENFYHYFLISDIKWRHSTVLKV